MLIKRTPVSSLLRRLALTAALALGGLLVAQDYSDARSGSGKSSGSRGERTQTAPPSTNTAPKAGQPMDRTMTQSPAGKTAGAATAPAKKGFGGLLMGGLLGAGLIGLFAGAGLFGGLGSFAAFLGLLLQVALIGGIVWLAFAFFKSRSQPAAATQAAGAGSVPPTGTMANTAARASMMPMGGGAVAAPSGPLAIVQNDYQAFERLLGDIQGAYSREDVDGLGNLTTPEMLSYFANDLAENGRKGVRNDIGGIKLLQGDLSEAWREESGEYATVALRFSLTDAMVDRKTGQVISGSKTALEEATEIWTFRRDHGADARGWQLSAIQQVEG